VLELRLDTEHLSAALIKKRIRIRFLIADQAKKQG
jgi:hypothetical protein